MNDLIVSHLSKSFGGKAVLRDFSLTLPAGETVCVMGRSGCGKTTLLNLIAGFLRPDAGCIEGVPARLSAVFQEDRLCEDFTAVANIRLATGKSCPDELIRAHLGELGLADAADLPVRQLSGGMKRRVAIARAALYGGDLLLLDEAFKGLDGETKTAAMDYVLRCAAGKSILCITHDETVAARFGGRQIRMEPLEP